MSIGQQVQRGLSALQDAVRGPVERFLSIKSQRARLGVQVLCVLGILGVVIWMLPSLEFVIRNWKAALLVLVCVGLKGYSLHRSTKSEVERNAVIALGLLEGNGGKMPWASWRGAATTAIEKPGGADVACKALINRKLVSVNDDDVQTCRIVRT